VSGSLAAPFTLDEQIACVEREIRMRERVYPRWVEAKKMSQAKADHEIACMRAALKTLQTKRLPDPLCDALNSGDGSYRP